MARNFDTANDIGAVSAFDPPTTGSVAFRLNPNWSSGDGLKHKVFSFFKTSNEFSFLKWEDNNLYVGWNTAAGGDDRIIVADTGLFTSGTDASWVFIWNDTANTCEIFLDNVSKGSRTADLATFTGITGIDIGNDSASTTQLLDSRLSEFAMWDVELGFDSRGTLAKGAAPSMVELSGLLDYTPYFGDISPEPDYVGGHNVTITGADKVDHPRMIYPAAPQVFPPTPAAPGGGNPLASSLMMTGVGF